MYWITVHTWCMLLYLHLTCAGVELQELLYSYTKLRANPGSVYLLGLILVVTLKTHLTDSADICKLTFLSSQEAVSQNHLKNNFCISLSRVLLKLRNISTAAYKLRGSLILLNPYHKESKNFWGIMPSSLFRTHAKRKINKINQYELKQWLYFIAL